MPNPSGRCISLSDSPAPILRRRSVCVFLALGALFFACDNKGSATRDGGLFDVPVSGRADYCETSAGERFECSAYACESDDMIVFCDCDQVSKRNENGDSVGVVTDSGALGACSYDSCGTPGSCVLDCSECADSTCVAEARDGASLEVLPQRGAAVACSEQQSHFIVTKAGSSDKVIDHSTALWGLAVPRVLEISEWLALTSRDPQTQGSVDVRVAGLSLEAASMNDQLERANLTVGESAFGVAADTYFMQEGTCEDVNVSTEKDVGFAIRFTCDFDRRGDDEVVRLKVELLDASWWHGEPAYP